MFNMKTLTICSIVQTILLAAILLVVGAKISLDESRIKAVRDAIEWQEMEKYINS